jgi:hypothetical protein
MSELANDKEKLLNQRINHSFTNSLPNLLALSVIRIWSVFAFVVFVDERLL